MPCGDFQWMHRFLLTRNDISYTGIDIVPELIHQHQKNFQDCDSWKFVLQDASKTSLNENFDIVLMRHVLQHLSNKDSMKILFHVSNSGSKYLLVTTFPEMISSQDLPEAGGFRQLNLQLPPISLTPPLCLHKDGNLRDGGYLGLWKLPLTQARHCGSFKGFNNSIVLDKYNKLSLEPLNYQFLNQQFHACP